MPIFRCTVRQDAWINHSADIEAGNAEEASQLAVAAFKTGDTSVTFEELFVSGFDHVECDPEECDLLDEATERSAAVGLAASEGVLSILARGVRR